MSARQDGGGGDTAGGFPQKPGPNPERNAQLFQAQCSQLRHPVEVEFVQPGQILVFDSRHEAERQRGQKRCFFTCADYVFAIGFHQTCGHFGDEFVRSYRPDWIQAEAGFDLPPQSPGDVRGTPEQTGGAGDIYKQMSVGLPGFDER